MQGATMMMWNVAQVFVVIVALSSCAAVWWLQQTRDRLRASYAEAHQWRERIELINGLVVKWPRDVLNTGLQNPQAPWQLVIIASDACRACTAILPEWKTLLEEMPAHQQISVELVSLAGDALVGQLAAIAHRRRVPYLVLRVTDPLTFAVSTGIRATPKILVLDADRRIRFVGHSIPAATLLSVTRTPPHMTAGRRDS
jgi:hypothetical protein